MRYLVSVVLLCVLSLSANACPLVANVAGCQQAYVQPNVVVVPQLQYAQTPLIQANVGYWGGVGNLAVGSYGGVGFNGVVHNSFGFNSASGYGSFGVNRTFVRQRVVVVNRGQERVGVRGGLFGGAFRGVRVRIR